jgi:hypothetical protein
MSRSRIALTVAVCLSIANVGCRGDEADARGTRRGALAPGSTFVERAKLIASGGATSSELSQIAISGDTIAITGPGNNFGPTAPVGAAYVFVRPPGGWAGTLAEQATLVPSDGLAGDYFSRIHMKGDVIVVGSYEDNVGANANQGSAYVFLKPPGGWSGSLNQSAKLTAADGAAEDRFGLRVAVSDDIIAVAARGDDSLRGSVYVFNEPAAGWSGNLTHSAKLTASDRLPNDQFGSAILISGDTIVVGAFFDDAPANDEGSAYVFVRPAAGWSGNLTQQAKLVAGDASPDSFFGTVIAQNGDTIAVGAPDTIPDGGGSGGPGAVYVFEKPVTGWAGTLTHAAKLTAADSVVGDRFGVSVAFHGDTLVVGADSIEVGANADQGSLYVFQKPPAGWSGTLTARPTIRATDSAAGDLFGQQLAIDGDTLAVGSPFDDVGANPNQGSVTVFVVGQAPALTLPANLTVEATSAAGAVVTFTVQATDPEDGTLTPACLPASGSTFPLGTTQVDCSVSDADGQQATGGFLVTVGDTTPPAVAVPGDITAEATGPAGAVVAFTATAVDRVDGASAPTCTPASGAQFPLGATLVTCAATDARGNVASAAFTVTVSDATAPGLTVPGDIPAEATGPAGAAVTYAAAAADVVDGPIAPVCAPASGAVFPLGTTPVTCTATDARGNTASATFSVTVADTTPPALALPAAVTAVATSDAGAVVTYAATASDLVDGVVAAVCTPDAGAVFPIGATIVSCFAADAAGNPASGTFTVTVEAEPDPDPETMPFASFKVFAQIDLRRRAADDRFAVEALFSTGAGSDGIDPLAEPVALALGSGSWTVPAGAFRRTWFGAFVFEGSVGGTRLDLAIHPLPGGRFLLIAAGSRAELGGTANPVTVSFAIGDDAGTAAVIAAIH